MWRIHHSQLTASTNLDARSGEPGDVFTTDEQTAGRGRLDHRWYSAPGENLMFSAVIEVTGLDPWHVSTLPLVIGLAVADTCRSVLPPEKRIMLKWPNDVLVEGRKICGILCERHADNVIAGVGINVKQREFPPEIASRATSMILSGNESEPQEILKICLRNFDELLPIWRGSGFAALQERFSHWDFLKGKRIRVLRTDDDPRPLQGICEGVARDGTLIVNGESVFAGEAHIDME